MKYPIYISGKYAGGLNGDIQLNPPGRFANEGETAWLDLDDAKKMLEKNPARGSWERKAIGLLFRFHNVEMPLAIDITKLLKTRNGKKVIAVEYKPRTDNGELVSFPIKGTIIIREAPKKMEYVLWNEQGNCGFPGKDVWDLMEG